MHKRGNLCKKTDINKLNKALLGGQKYTQCRWLSYIFRAIM